jgi:hypothetical protein
MPDFQSTRPNKLFLEPHGRTGVDEPERAAQAMSAAPANASWSRVPAPGFRVTTAGTHRWAGRGHADADKAPCRPFQNVNSGMFWWTTFCAVLLDRTSTMLLLLAILASGHGSVIFGLDHGKRIGRSSQSLLFTQMVLLFLYIKKRERETVRIHHTQSLDHVEGFGRSVLHQAKGRPAGTCKRTIIPHHFVRMTTVFTHSVFRHCFSPSVFECFCLPVPWKPCTGACSKKQAGRQAVPFPLLLLFEHWR